MTDRISEFRRKICIPKDLKELIQINKKGILKFIKSVFSFQDFTSNYYNYILLISLDNGK